MMCTPMTHRGDIELIIIVTHLSACQDRFQRLFVVAVAVVAVALLVLVLVCCCCCCCCCIASKAAQLRGLDGVLVAEGPLRSLGRQLPLRLRLLHRKLWRGAAEPLPGHEVLNHRRRWFYVDTERTNLLVGGTVICTGRTDHILHPCERTRAFVLEIAIPLLLY